ncbi:MAG: hypothetical protein ABIB46_03820 [bacterium]
MKEKGYNTPVEAHLLTNLTKDLTKKLISNKVKTVMGNEKKEWREKIILVDDFIRKGSKKEEVLGC